MRPELKKDGSIGELKNILTKECREKIYHSLLADPTIRDKSKFGLETSVITEDLAFQVVLTTSELLHIAMRAPKNISESEAVCFCLERDNLEKLIE